MSPKIGYPVSSLRQNGTLLNDICRDGLVFSQKETKMASMVFPIMFAAAAVVLLLRWRAQAKRCNAQTWDELVARLEPGWNAGQLSQCIADQDSSVEERWERFHGARGLYVMFRNAQVMLDMANYAVRNCETVDRELVAALRSDALQIRVSVVVALAQYAMHRVNERICANALQAASMYRDMTARMSELLDVSGGQLAPAMVGAR